MKGFLVKFLKFALPFAVAVIAVSVWLNSLDEEEPFTVHWKTRRRTLRLAR
jgi:hypothetical protein